MMRKNGLFNLIKHFIAFAAALVYWELLCYRQVNGSLSDMPGWLLVFVPAIAAFLCVIGGWSKNRHAVRITGIVAMLIPAVFYTVQLMYFKTFGSFASVSMAGAGGDALKNFGWGLAVTIKQNLGLIGLCLLPLALFVAGVCIATSKKGKHEGGGKTGNYGPILHAAALALAVCFWLLAVAALPLGGTESFSPYAAYHSSLVDTDSASSKIGVLANSAVEAGGMLFGIDDDSSDELTASASLDAAAQPVVELIPAAPEANADAQPGTDDAPANPEAADTTGPEEAVPETDRSPNIIESLDFAALSEGTPDKNVKELCDYFAAQPGTNRNEYTGLFEGYNLIYICGESFSSYAIDETVTPTLWKLAHGGIVLDNFYNSFKNTTTNGEFAFATGLWPDVSREGLRGSGMGTFAQTSDNYWPMGLGTMFNEQCGCTSRAYHNYLGDYYRRSRCWPALGFSCKFMNDGMKFTTSWPASDLEMMEQSIGDYINDDQFCAYYMTFSGHGPYTSENVMYRWNIEKVTELLGDRAKDLEPDAIGYLACNYELEKAMTYLLECLEEAGKLENTVIVLTGDHYPYYLLDKPRNSIAGHTTDTTYEIYKSTCTMYCAGIDPIVVETPCCTVDILPTVYNLFGLEYDSRLFAGTDIFSGSTHVAALYNKSFITNTVRYDATTGRSDWLIDTSSLDEQRMTDYLDGMISYVNARYGMSLKMEDSDFYRLIFIQQ